MATEWLRRYVDWDGTRAIAIIRRRHHGFGPTLPPSLRLKTPNLDSSYRRYDYTPPGQSAHGCTIASLPLPRGPSRRRCVRVHPVHHVPSNWLGRDFVVGDMHGCFRTLESGALSQGGSGLMGSEAPGDHDGRGRQACMELPGRVAAGGCPPAAPTDPDMPNSGIRLVASVGRSGPSPAGSH